MGFSAVYLRHIFVKQLVQEVGTKNHYFGNKIKPYGLIFRPHVEENECDTQLAKTSKYFTHL